MPRQVKSEQQLLHETLLRAAEAIPSSPSQSPSVVATSLDLASESTSAGAATSSVHLNSEYVNEQQTKAVRSNNESVPLPLPPSHIQVQPQRNDDEVCPLVTDKKEQQQQNLRRRRRVHVAVQGCCHGELDKIYAQITEHERTSGNKVDFLLCCGDFQSVRNEEDMRSMAVPDKYKTFGDFVSYFRGQKRPPVLTLFVGGNHEASNLLAEEYYGGYVSDGIYYLGHSAVVRVCGVRIGALSGIYKGRDYTRPYPTVPYQNAQSLREAYHVRKFEVDKLKLFVNVHHHHHQLHQQQQARHKHNATNNPSTPPSSTLDFKDCSKDLVVTPTSASFVPPISTSSTSPHAIDMMVSHDWPVGITKYGNEAALLKIKPFFEDDIAHGALGNPHTLELLQSMKPRYWFAAHLHCHFTASVPHIKWTPGNRVPSVVCHPTEFVALDKCVHHSRKCVTFITIEVDDDEKEDENHQPTTLDTVNEENRPAAAAFPKVLLDPVWREIIRSTHHLLRVDASATTTTTSSPGTSWEHVLRDISVESIIASSSSLTAEASASSCNHSTTTAIPSSMIPDEQLRFPMHSTSALLKDLGSLNVTRRQSQPQQHRHDTWRNPLLLAPSNDSSRRQQQHHQSNNHTATIISPGAPAVVGKVPAAPTTTNNVPASHPETLTKQGDVEEDDAFSWVEDPVGTR